MKFHIERSVMEDAINTVIRSVAAKSSNPAMEGILLEAGGDTLTVTGFNGQMAIRTRCEAQVEREGGAVLNAKLFGEMIRRMPEDTVTVDCGDQLSADLSCGDAHYNVSAMSAADYPELPDVGDSETVDIREIVLKSMIAETNYAVSTNEARPVHTGELFDIVGGKLNVVACDGFRLAVRTEPVEAQDLEFVVPGLALNEVERLCRDEDDMVKIAVGGRHIQFFIGSAELISRRLDGEFIDYKNAIPKNNDTIVQVNTKTMMQSIDRVSVVVNEKMKSPMRCKIGAGRIEMSARTATGAAKDVCKVEGDGKDMEIGFNNRFLYDAMRYAPEPVVNMAFRSGVAPAVITGAGGDGRFTYMVLPVRLKNE